jgi:hypothetical protein
MTWSELRDGVARRVVRPPTTARLRAPGRARPGARSPLSPRRPDSAPPVERECTAPSRARPRPRGTRKRRHVPAADVWRLRVCHRVSADSRFVCQARSTIQEPYQRKSRSKKELSLSTAKPQAHSAPAPPPRRRERPRPYHTTCPRDLLGMVRTSGENHPSIACEAPQGCCAMPISSGSPGGLPKVGALPGRHDEHAVVARLHSRQAESSRRWPTLSTARHRHQRTTGQFAVVHEGWSAP